MVYSVVIDFFNLKHRLFKGSGLSKVETHALVATDINYQAARFQAGFLLFKYEINGVIGVLKGTIDNNSRFINQLT